MMPLCPTVLGFGARRIPTFQVLASFSELQWRITRNPTPTVDGINPALPFFQEKTIIPIV